MAEAMNPRPIRLHPDAEAEFADAIRWYEEHADSGVALQFAEAVDAAINALAAGPLRCPIVWQDKRRCLVRRFPFGVFYEVMPEEIQVLAIYHLSRRPGGWHGRT